MQLRHAFFYRTISLSSVGGFWHVHTVPDPPPPATVLVTSRNQSATLTPASVWSTGTSPEAAQQDVSPRKKSLFQQLRRGSSQHHRPIFPFGTRHLQGQRGMLFLRIPHLFTDQAVLDAQWASELPHMTLLHHWTWTRFQTFSPQWRIKEMVARFVSCRFCIWKHHWRHAHLQFCCTRRVQTKRYDTPSPRFHNSNKNLNLWAFLPQFFSAWISAQYINWCHSRELMLLCNATQLPSL